MPVIDRPEKTYLTTFCVAWSRRLKYTRLFHSSVRWTNMQMYSSNPLFGQSATGADCGGGMKKGGDDCDIFFN